MKSKKYNDDFFYYILYSYIAYFIKYNYICCHHPILGDSPKFIFFPKKIKKNKIKAGNAEKADQERLQNRRKSSCNFRRNFKAQVYAVMPKNRKMQIQRSN